VRILTSPLMNVQEINIGIFPTFLFLLPTFQLSVNADRRRSFLPVRRRFSTATCFLPVFILSCSSGVPKARDKLPFDPFLSKSQVVASRPSATLFVGSPHSFLVPDFPLVAPDRRLRGLFQKFLQARPSSFLFCCFAIDHFSVPISFMSTRVPRDGLSPKDFSAFAFATMHGSCTALIRPQHFFFFPMIWPCGV